MSLLPFRQLGLTLLALLLMHMAPLAVAQTVEQKLKAAFLYRFTQFTEWPPQALAERDGVLLLCMLGKDSFDGALDDIEGKPVGERTIAIRYIKTLPQINQCQIVFVNQSRSAWDEIQQRSQNAHVLAVSDHQGFAATGGIIELTSAGNRIQFIINLTAAKKADLHISAHLLKLAQHIYD